MATANKEWKGERYGQRKAKWNSMPANINNDYKHIINIKRRRRKMNLNSKTNTYTSIDNIEPYIII